jgi:hypothetical protein
MQKNTHLQGGHEQPMPEFIEAAAPAGGGTDWTTLINFLLQSIVNIPDRRASIGTQRSAQDRLAKARVTRFGKEHRGIVARFRAEGKPSPGSGAYLAPESAGHAGSMK